MRYFLFVWLLALLAGHAHAQRPRWERVIDFPGTPGIDTFGYMRTLPGGDYLVYGVGNDGRGYPATVARYQPDGTAVFERQGRALGTLEQDMLPLASGNLLLVGTVGPGATLNLFFQRLRATGDTLPGLRYPSSLFRGIPAQMQPDGSDSVRVLLTAAPDSPGLSRYALATADTAGHLGPIRRYPAAAPALNNAYACDLAPTPRGGWLLAGEIFTVTGNSAAAHPYLVETDHLGRLRRQRLITLFSATDDERVNRVWHNLIRLRDGSGYVLSGWQQVGSSGNSGTPRWGWLCKLDTALNVVWTYRHPPQATTYLLPTRVRELPDGSLGWLVGDGGGPGGQTITSSLYLLRVSPQGQLLRQRTFTSALCARLGPYSWQPTPDGYGAVVTGYALTCAPTGSAVVAYTARLDDAFVLAATPPGGAAGTAQLWPNPTSEAVTWQGAVPPGAGPAELLLLDALGREVRRVAVAGRGAQAQQNLPLAGLAPGAYAVRLLVAGLPVGAVSRLVISLP